MFPTDAVIVAGARTPMVRIPAAFFGVSAIDLRATLARSGEAVGREPEEFDHADFWQRDADKRGMRSMARGTWR